MNIPECFVWTRIGHEAGETLENILARKEQERLKNGGVFLWGVGNSILPSLEELLIRNPKPEVVFSRIESKPRPIDVDPGETVHWTQAITASGLSWPIPAGSVVTSRAGRPYHFALVCYSDCSLTEFVSTETVSIGNLRNLTSGRNIGASQVTAVVSKAPGSPVGRMYPVALQARLTHPYAVRLITPRQ